ncbi:hypothetical protein BJX99DRAFT_222722 [Aspergillus californicus]
MSTPPEFQVTPVNNKETLPEADIDRQFLIEHFPIPDGQNQLGDTKEGIKIVVYIEGDELKRPAVQELDQLGLLWRQELDPLLSSAAVVQAIRSCNRIGSVWVVHRDGKPMHLLALHAAMGVKTRELETMSPCSWDAILDIAREQLEPIHSNHILSKYQETLLYLERKGEKMLKEAKSTESTVDSC